MSNKESEAKWDKIYSSRELESDQIKPAEVLSEHDCLLPKSGDALDFASGLGGNAIFLTEQGLSAHAWDISQQANDKLHVYLSLIHI